MTTFGVLFVFRLNKLNDQSICQWSESSWHSCHCGVIWNVLMENAADICIPVNTLNQFRTILFWLVNEDIL